LPSVLVLRYNVATYLNLVEIGEKPPQVSLLVNVREKEIDRKKRGRRRKKERERERERSGNNRGLPSCCV